MRRLKTDSGQPKTSKIGLWVGAAVMVLAAVAALYSFWPKGAPVEEDAIIMLAVLPFENLGSAEDEYFADGMTDEITSRLARISALRVISRTSAMQYKNTDKTIPQIGEELGVDYILEGTILWDKSGDTDRVRITPQLIEVTSDFHVWTDNIERPLTKLFAMQADIALHITEALNVTLLEPERRAVEAKPTENMEAYDYYMRGRSYADRGFDSSDIGIGIEMFEKAVAIDSNFALGYAKLSSTLSSTNWLHSANEHTLQRAKSAIDRALELAPDDPLVREALARYHYHGHRDYERALEELALARRSLPDDAEILGTIGWIKRRQGRFEEALEYLEQSAALNPRSARSAYHVGITYIVMRRYDRAQDWFDRAISLSPDWSTPHVLKSFLCLLRDGNDIATRSVLEAAGKTIDAEELASMWALCEMFARNYEGALDRLPADGYLMTRGLIYYLMNDTIKSTAYYDSARILLEQKEPGGLTSAGEREASLGITYAHLRRPEDAIRLGRQAMDILPLSIDAYEGSGRLIANANIHIALGDHDRAIDLIERLLSMPSEISVPFLRGHPLYDPLRDQPRFKALLKRYDTSN